MPYKGESSHLPVASVVRLGCRLLPIGLLPSCHPDQVFHLSAVQRLLTHREAGGEAWKAGRGYSSPSISGDVVYIGAGYRYTSAGRQGEPPPGLCALDVATGKELWRFRTRQAVTRSPAIAGGVVYFTDQRGRLYAVK